MNRNWLLVIVLILAWVSWSRYTQLEQFALLCPDLLIQNQETLELWKNGKVERIFSSYTDYLKFHDFLQLSLDQKGLGKCAPLQPMTVDHRPRNGSLVGTRHVIPKFFNIEGFQGPTPPFYLFVLEGTSKDKQALEYNIVATVNNLVTLTKVNDKETVEPLHLVGELQTASSPFIKQTDSGTVQVTTSIRKFSEVYLFMSQDLSKPVQVRITSEKLSSVQPRLVFVQANGKWIDVPLQLQKDNIQFKGVFHMPVEKRGTNPVADANTALLQQKKQQLVIQSQEVIVDYLQRNPSCKQRIMDKDTSFYFLFQKAYENYMTKGFQQTLGYVPDKSDIESMNLDEAKAFISLYKAMPPCDQLIMTYRPPMGNNIQKGQQVAVTPSPAQHTQSLSQTQLSALTTGQVPPLPTADQLLQLSKVDKYVQQIGNKLQQTWENLIPAASSLSPMPILPTMPSFTQPNKEVVQTLENKLGKFLTQEQKLQQGQSTQPTALTQPKKALNVYQQMELAKQNAMNEAPDFIKKGDSFESQFKYKPEYVFDHQEPSKEIYSAYGWSFMPPQSWSVPQKRPPVCLPASESQTSSVSPVYDRSVPLDALDWNQSIPVKASKKTHFNPDYFYPGWIADKIMGE